VPRQGAFSTHTPCEDKLDAVLAPEEDRANELTNLIEGSVSAISTN